MEPITILKNGRIVNEGQVTSGHIWIQGERILAVTDHLNDLPANANLIDVAQAYIMPGVIDDQVHFREPGLTHKATIETESKAVV